MPVLRVLLSSVLLVLATTPAPLAAQSDQGDQAQQPGKCHLSAAKKKGSSILGGLLGGLAERATGSSTIAAYVPFNTFGTTLTDAIACQLDKDEQKKAADATTLAVSRGVGDTENWTSDTRKDVSGSSTVLAQTASADGGSCVNVSDVIIVNGEETRANKKMCRAPGASGYTLAA